MGKQTTEDRRSNQIKRSIHYSYTPLGNRRVYTTKWLNTWVEYEREHPTDRHGDPVKVIHRTNSNGKSYRIYLSYKDIDTITARSYYTDRELKRPNDIPYLRAKRIGIMSLYAISCLHGDKFVQAVERECQVDSVSMSLRHRENNVNGRTHSERRCCI